MENCTEIGLVLHGKLYRNRIGTPWKTVPKSDWYSMGNCTEIGLVLHRYCTGIGLVLHRYCTGIGLVLGGETPPLLEKILKI